jgi:Carboxypeptidase regulatory-like domain/TonB-dependent Receptor Plug Domain/TonB dependent receptor
VKLKSLSSLMVVLAICLGTFVAGMSSPAWAQQAAGSITGTVVDPSGGAIPNATVTVRDVDRGTTWTTKTSSAGIYEFPQISVGTVVVSADAQGFSNEVRNSFVLTLNQVARVDFKMQVGQVTATVEVNAAPPLLQTDSTELGTIIDARTTAALPLATRDINQLTLLVPGVVSPNIYAFQSPQTTFGTGRPYVNGAREQDNNFSLDGMDTNQADNNEVAYVPGPDAVEEFDIITSNAPADYGNYIGGVIVETLKSGTNHFHGNAFEFLRNTDLDANSWQNKAEAVTNPDGLPSPRNPLQWNEFGGTVGGPILKNKLFFFADFQGSRYNTPASTLGFAPIPAAFRTGDFSSLCTTGFTVAGLCTTPGEQLYNPASSATATGRTPFANNQVPVLSAAAGAILSSSLFPSPSTTTYLQHSYTDQYQGDAKIDWQASQHDHIYGRYSQMYTINNTTNSIALLPSETRDYPLKNFVVDYARQITPSLVNEARLGVQIFPANDQQFTNPTGQNLPTLFGIPGVQDTILPDINFNGLYTDVGSGDLVEIFHDTTIEAEDALTWTHGKHSIHGGFEYFHYIMNDEYPGNQGVAGEFIFNGQFTGNTGTGGGNPVADFLLGLPETVDEGTAFHFNLRNSLFGGFVQDNWQAASNLVVNLGFRYEQTTPRGDKNPAGNVNFDQITGTPELATNYKDYRGKDNYQPRIGFAWQPAALPQTVVRAAYDFSTYMEGNGVSNMAVVNPPNVVTHTENNQGLAEPLTTLDEGYASFPTAACTAAGLEAFSAACLSSVQIHETNPNLKPADDQQWNITVQHQFHTNSTVSVGYVGNKVDHMSDINYWNQKQIGPLVPDPNDSNISIPSVIPGPYSQPLVAAGASVRFNDSEAFSRYNAFELVAAQRDFHGLSAQVSFTWSKCLSNSLGYFGAYGDEEGTGQSQTNGTYNFFQNDYDEKADYGRCITDTRSNFDGYVVYDLPFGKGKQFAAGVSPVVNQAIGGWQVASDFTFHTGFAIDPTGVDESGTGSENPRPNCVPGADNYGSGKFENLGGNLGVQFLNPGAVSLPATGTFGNCQVGFFTGPGLKTADLNITKKFPITQSINVQFMAQFINVTNSPIFGVTPGGFSCGPTCNGVIQTGPNGGSTGAGTFGLAQSQDPGREIQFAIKLNY